MGCPIFRVHFCFRMQLQADGQKLSSQYAISLAARCIPTFPCAPFAANLMDATFGDED